jgi:hypothetical protein
MLSEDEIRRVTDLRVADPVARQWLDRLLEERRHLVAVIQALARQIHHLRARMRQAAAYLDGLADNAERTARAPWPSKLACPTCGAAVDRLTVDYRAGEGHSLIRTHPDGTTCGRKPQKSD